MKKITVLFTVLMMLAASSAWAVDGIFPASLNGSNARFFTGFNVNASISAIGGDSHNSTFVTFNTTHVQAYTVKGGDAKIDGNASLWGEFGVNNDTDGTIAAYTQSNTTDGNTTQINYNVAYQSINGLTQIGQVNGSSSTSTKAEFLPNPYYFATTPSNGLMAGISNSTWGTGTQTANDDIVGANFALGFVNGSFEGTNVFSSDNTWDLYAVGVEFGTNRPYYMVGQVKLNSAPGTDNAQVKYAKYDSAGTLTDQTSSWITYNATTDNNNLEMSLKYKGYLDLVENATINYDRNLISGYAVEPSYKHFVIMIKNGVGISTGDLNNRGFKTVYAGLGIDKAAGNATMGIMDMQFDNSMAITGNSVSATGLVFKQRTDSLNGYTVAVADTPDTNHFKLTQSNMTLTSAASALAGNFYGKQSADKSYAVGIYQSAWDSEKASYNIAVMIPNSAVVANIQGANAAYQNNATIAAWTNIARNNTDYTGQALRTAFTSVPSNFIPLTGAIGFNATWNGMGAQKGDIYYTFQAPFSGVGNRIDTLALYKIFPTVDKTVRTFNYASEPTMSTDGAWWISTAVGDGYLASDSYLVPATDYYINYVIKDNGDYDYRSQTREFGDPIVLGVMDSSSSSSGCVFNPAAGFGLEWLLLMLAPLVAVVRSRFKK